MCTKKTSGIALLVIGFVLVALGVIIGLILPNKAQTTVEDNVCVDSKDSPGYGRWVSLLANVLIKKNELLLPFKALYGYNSITQTAVINIFEIRV